MSGSAGVTLITACGCTKVIAIELGSGGSYPAEIHIPIFTAPSMAAYLNPSSAIPTESIRVRKFRLISGSNYREVLEDPKIVATIEYAVPVEADSGGRGGLEENQFPMTDQEEIDLITSKGWHLISREVSAKMIPGGDDPKNYTHHH